MTLTDLRRLTKIWAERLRLEDWNTTVRWSTDEENKESDWSGLCTPQVTIKEAEIVIVRPELATSVESKDTEYLVVHELLHLHHAPFETKEGSMAALAEENIVHAIATLLLALDRRDETILGRKLSRRASLKKGIKIATKRKDTVTKEEIKDPPNPTREGRQEVSTGSQVSSEGRTSSSPRS